MMMRNNKTLVLLLAILAVSGTTAFGVNRMGSTRKVASTFLSSSALYATTSTTTGESDPAEESTADVAAAKDEPEVVVAEDEASLEEPAADTADAVVVPDEEEATEVAPPEAAVEDPAVTALKQEIFDLESAVKAKTRQLSVAQEQAERYTKTGYARRVAEVENTRRVRKTMENSNAFSETANVVTSFLPIYDELMALRDMYQEDDFGKQYTGLTGAMNTALKALGVEEVTVEVGTTTDEGKVTVVSEEHSKDYPKGTILRTGKVGLELKGNILRLPEVVVSLGAAEAGTGFGA